MPASLSQEPPENVVPIAGGTDLFVKKPDKLRTQPLHFLAREPPMYAIGAYFALVKAISPSASRLKRCGADTARPACRYIAYAALGEMTGPALPARLQRLNHREVVKKQLRLVGDNRYLLLRRDAIAVLIVEQFAGCLVINDKIVVIQRSRAGPEGVGG